MKQKLTIEEVIKRGASHRAQRLSMKDFHQLRVAFWDIEASNLDADFGIMLCASVKTLGEKKMRTYRIDDYPGKSWDDSGVARDVARDLEKHDVIVHHYGDRYDIPFLNTRLMANENRILRSDAMCFVDTWWNIRKRLKLHNNRLASLIEFLETSTDKTRLDGNIWVRATAGDPKSIKYVVDHNIADVKALEEVTMNLLQYFPLRYTYLK